MYHYIISRLKKQSQIDEYQKALDATAHKLILADYEKDYVKMETHFRTLSSLARSATFPYDHYVERTIVENSLQRAKSLEPTYKCTLIKQ
jgi:hypothetical protein